MPVFPSKTLRALLLGGAIAVACSMPTDSCGCSPAPLTAVLYGQVLDGAGAPFAGALVRARAGAPGCTAGFRDLGSASSTSGGLFRVRLYLTFNARVGDCVQALAEPPSGTNWQTSAAVPFAVVFDYVVRDSARVDLRLRAP